MLVGRQEQHPVCKNWVMRSWHGYLSGARCIWSSWCYCHPVICRFIKIQIGSTFLLPAYPDCPGKEAVKPVSCLFGRCLLWFTRNMSAFIPWLMSTLCAVGWWRLTRVVLENRPLNRCLTLCVLVLLNRGQFGYVGVSICVCFVMSCWLWVWLPACQHPVQLIACKTCLQLMPQLNHGCV